MHIRGGLHRIPWRLLIPVLAAVVVTGTALPQRGGQDPVAQLDQDLKSILRDQAGNPDAKLREQILQRDVAALRNIADLRRALQLQNWKDNQPEAAPEVQALDRAYRSRIADLFRQELQQAMKSGNPVAAIAAADLINEVGISLRGSTAQDSGGVTRPLAPDLVALLRSDNPNVQRAAARALGKINADPSIAAPALGRAGRQPGDEALHDVAAKSLGDLIRVATKIYAQQTVVELQPPLRKDVLRTLAEVVPLLAPGIADSDPAVRRQALESLREAAAALGEMVGKPYLAEDQPPLGRKWTAEERERVEGQRQAVAMQRNEIVPIAKQMQALAPQLRQALVADDREVRLAASKALEEMGNTHMRLLRLTQSVPSQQPGEPATPQSRIPERLKPRTRPTHGISMVAAHTAAADVSARLLVALQQQPQPLLTADDPLQDLILDALPALEQQLQDPDVQVRLGALNVIEMLDAQAYRAAPLLLRALDDRNRFVRWQAARILGKTRPLPDAVPGLARLVRDADLGARLAAATTIAAYGDVARGALPDVIFGVNHGDAESREAAIRTLENFTPALAQAALPALEEAVFDQDARVRRAAAEALGNMGPVARPTEPALRRALSEERDAEVLRAVSEALISILPKSPR